MTGNNEIRLLVFLLMLLVTVGGNKVELRLRHALSLAS